MFNNFVNRHDIFRLASVAGRAPSYVLGIFSRLFSSSGEKVAHAWSRTERGQRHWWDIPAVRQRWNLLVTGDEQLEARHWFCKKYLAGTSDAMALSIGCGAGERERAWAKTGAFKRIDAFDLSPQRIEMAKQKATEEGLDGVLNYYVSDGLTGIESAKYDLVIGEQSVHHFTDMERQFAEIRRILRPDGLVYLDEFVGPRRLQWTKAQVSAANALLRRLPREYRVRFDGKGVKKSVERPSVLRMLMVDPSEAVESDRILPALQQEFEILEMRPYGGAILHLLFHDIAHHFVKDEAETQKLLKLCFDAEDEAMAAGTVESDFVVAVARPVVHSS